MHAGVRSLDELLSAEAASVRALEAALRQEHAALKAANADALERATAEKNAAVQAQQAVQRARAEWLQQQGRAPDIPFSRLIDDLPATQKQRSDHAGVLELARQCQETNRRNGVLIQRLQERARSALGILRRSEQQPSLYSTHGLQEGAEDSRSLGKA